MSGKTNGAVLTGARRSPIYVNVININMNEEAKTVHTVGEWLRQGRDWLDARGKGAWIAAMVLGFILFWPIGLVILFYLLGSGRMGKGCRSWKRRGASAQATGNVAFDEYREETLKRLEEERTAFVGFLDKLRRAKDKAEFDQFMNDRGRKGDDDPVAV